MVEQQAPHQGGAWEVQIDQMANEPLTHFLTLNISSKSWGRAACLAGCSSAGTWVAGRHDLHCRAILPYTLATSHFNSLPLELAHRKLCYSPAARKSMDLGTEQDACF